MLYRLKTLIICISIGCSCAVAAKSDAVTDALKTLDAALDMRHSYIAGRQQHIDSLTALMKSGKADAGVIMEIAEGYTSFNNDSALVYLKKGIDSTQGVAQLPFRWKFASLLPLGGFFDSAQKEFENIPADSVPAEMLTSYYDAGRQMHSYIAAFFQNYPHTKKEHLCKALALQEKMLELLPQQSADYKFNLGEYYLLTGRSGMARVLLEEVTDSEPANSNLRARAAHHLAQISKDEGEEDNYIYYLALASTADILSATREVLALQELGTAVYSYADISRAHKYLSTALENAVECGTPVRMVDSAKSLPIIERAHSDNTASWRRTLYWIIGAMAILMIVLIITMIVLRHEMHRMSVLQANLRTANNAKEVYISQFLQLCSIYMDKLNSFCKIAARKLAAGQSDELYRMTKSGKFVEEQSREFYDVFDNAFLHIYPDFVDRVNTLLRADAQLELKPGELLNTDLRILAFMRLGIRESARIAQVLNYSLNTIYAYRNRLKARALDPDTFEAAVMNIASVS